MAHFEFKKLLVCSLMTLGSFSCSDDFDFNRSKKNEEKVEKGFDLGSLSFNVDQGKGEWTLVVVPDTQHYSQNRGSATISDMRRAFDWIVDAKDRLNIKMVQGLGDITESWSARWEWDNAFSAWNKLEGQVPYMPIVGNHDDPDMMNRYFPITRFSSKPWWGGDFGGIENNYFKMNISGEDYIFLHVESYDQFSDYRPLGLEWANNILYNYPNSKVILATHDNWETTHIREKLLKNHDNVVLSNAGHTCAREKHFKTQGPSGGITHNFITDYQCDSKEIMLLRVYHFKPLEDKVYYYTYSPVTGGYEQDADSQGFFALKQKNPNDIGNNDQDSDDDGDQDGDQFESCQKPYGGSILEIPGRIEAENYDLGCSDDPSYYDKTSGNIGEIYRTDDVDIGYGENGVGASVGWISTGEWMEYSVNVMEGGKYDSVFRISSDYDHGKIEISINDNVLTTASLPDTGGWNDWQEVSGPSLTLPEGKNIIRIFAKKSGFNLDWLELVKANDGCESEPYQGGPAKIPGTIEAENYDIGCPDSPAYYDTTEENIEGEYRDDAVDIGSGKGGGHAVTWIKDGEWLEYSVEIEKEANYQSWFLISSDKDVGTLKLFIDGVEISSSQIEVTGGWDLWRKVKGPMIRLNAGRHTLRALIETNGFNLDAMSFVAESTDQPSSGDDRWNLIWSDDFNMNGSPDWSHWEAKIDGNGGGNNELQYYSDRKKNLRVEDGKLIIEAHKESMNGRRYTSGKLVSRAHWLYGKIEVRAKLPWGRGTWPAIWMMPKNAVYGGWPHSGEIDIMEHVGYDQDKVHSNIHTTSYNHMNGTNKGDSIMVNGASDDFHTYTVEWDENTLSYYVDDNPTPHFVFRNDRRGDSATWPFDQSFYLILNIAVGGSWGGKEGVDDSIFSQRMEIDYVKVYERK